MAKKISKSNTQPGIQVPKNQTADTGKSLPLPELNGNDDSKWQKVFVISLIAVFVLMTIMSFSYGISGDEVDMNEYGKAIFKYFTSFGANTTVFNMPKEYNRDGVIQYYGGLFDFICAIVNKISPFAEYTTRHILNAWAGFIAMFFAAKISIRIFNRQAGVLCVWLMFLSPFFLGHAMNNPKDVPFATAYIAAVYCIILLFDHLPKPPIKYYIWAILSIGFTINVRVGGILLIPYLIVFAALTFFFKKFIQKEDVALKNWIKPILIVAILGYLLGSLFWPFALKDPINNPLTALHEMSNFKVSLAQLFEGSKMSSDELPTNYLIKSFIITNPYVVLIGLVLMAVYLFVLFKNKNAAILYFVLFTGLFPLAYIIYTKANVYHAWRHVLFIFPSLAVMSAGGWAMFSEYLAKRKLKYGMAIAGLLMLEPAYFIVTTFPNTITYFNGFAGGVDGAYGNYEMDYYYNSIKQCTDWFRKYELPKYKATDTIILASNAVHIVHQYLGDIKNLKLDYVRFPQRNQKKWDYTIFHIALIRDDEIRAGIWLPPSTLFKATSKGHPLSAVIKRPSYDDLKGFDAIQKNQADSALYYFNQYLKADPENIDMLGIMANIYHQLHQDNIAQQYNARINKILEGGAISSE